MSLITRILTRYSCAGFTLRGKKRNDDIRRIFGVACITDKVRQVKLWYGHAQRREEDDCVKRILDADVRRQRNREKIEKEMDQHRRVQHGGLAAQPGRRKEAS